MCKKQKKIRLISVLTCFLVACAFINPIKTAVYDINQRHRYEQDFKTSYEYIQGSLKNMSRKNQTSLESVFSKLIHGKKCTSNMLPTGFLCRDIIDTFDKYFGADKIETVQNYEWHNLDQEAPIDLSGQTIKRNKKKHVYNDYVIKLKNGIWIFNYDFYPFAILDRDSERHAAMYAHNYIGKFDVDVNGKNLPNTYGRDIFRFLILDDGTLYPYRGKNYYKSCRKYKINSTVTKELSGTTCAARIIEDNWKMKY